MIFFRNPQLFWALNFRRFFKTHTLTHTGKGPESTGQGQTGKILSGPVFLPHLLADDAADGIGSVLLHLGRGVGVGVQGEPRRIVAQRAGQRFHVYPAFQGQRGEGMSEVVEPDVFRADGFQNFIMGSSESVRVIHGPVLGDGNRYGLRGCFVCSSVNKSTTCCGSANVRMEFLVFGGLTASSPLMRFTCFVMESVRFSMSESDQSFPCT